MNTFFSLLSDEGDHTLTVLKAKELGFQCTDEPVLVACREIAQEEEQVLVNEDDTISTLTIPRQRKEQAWNLDLTGSPLKCSFDLDDDEEEQAADDQHGVKRGRRGLVLTPVSASTAR